ncbi:MAG TPA: antibiotic biosynthesis monooxygenase, partial [Solirubrobacteraceae bacterium]|nr:antibiotic biosynthesis monooxygenase [Solirubrobacteraceae bacterium]
MSVVKVNAITVPRERFEEFERRFASRAGRVEHADGFEGFELLRPNDD